VDVGLWNKNKRYITHTLSLRTLSTISNFLSVFRCGYIIVAIEFLELTILTYMNLLTDIRVANFSVIDTIKK